MHRPSRILRLAAKPLLFMMAFILLCAPWVPDLHALVFMRKLHPELHRFLNGDRQPCLRVLRVIRKFRAVRQERAFEEGKEGLGQVPRANPLPTVVFHNARQTLGGIRVRGGFRGWGSFREPESLEEQMKMVRDQPLIALIDREIYSFTGNYERGARIWVRGQIDRGSWGVSVFRYHLEFRGVTSPVVEAVQESIAALEEAQDDLARNLAESRGTRRHRQK